MNQLTVVCNENVGSLQNDVVFHFTQLSHFSKLTLKRRVGLHLRMDHTKKSECYLVHK